MGYFDYFDDSDPNAPTDPFPMSLLRRKKTLPERMGAVDESAPMPEAPGPTIGRAAPAGLSLRAPEPQPGASPYDMPVGRELAMTSSAPGAPAARPMPTSAAVTNVPQIGLRGEIERINAENAPEAGAGESGWPGRYLPAQTNDPSYRGNEQNAPRPLTLAERNAQPSPNSVPGAHGTPPSGDETDVRTKKQRFFDALKAFGMEFAQGGGLFQAAGAGIGGAMRSQTGPARLGRYGDIIDRADQANAYRKQKREEDIAEIPLRKRTAEAQARYAEARPDIELAKADDRQTGLDQRERGLDLRETQINNANTNSQADRALRAVKAFMDSHPGEEIPVDLKIAAGFPADMPPAAVHSQIVADAQGNVYRVNTVGPEGKVAGVTGKMNTQAQMVDVNGTLLKELGTEDQLVDNPEYKSFTATPSNTDAAIRAAMRDIPELQRTPEERAAYESGAETPEQKAAVRARQQAAWAKLPDEVKERYYGTVKGAPKRLTQQRNIPGYVEKRARRENELKQQAYAGNPENSQSQGSANLPKTPEEATARAAQLFPSNPEAQKLYIEKWTEQHAGTR